MRSAIALLAALLVLGLLSARSWLRAPATGLFEGPLTRVELMRGGGSLTLERRAAGSWTVTPPGDLADADAAERLAAGLAALTLGDVVAGREDAAAYGLAPADAVKVRAWRETARGPAEASFGRRALDGGLHAMEPGDAPVRFARGPDPDLLARPAEGWRERRLLPGGCPHGAEVREAGRPARRVPAGDPLCALTASGFEPASAVPFGGFERPYLTLTADGGGAFSIGARLSRRERAAAVEGRPGMMRVAVGGPL